METDDFTFVEKSGYVLEKRGQDLSPDLYFVMLFFCF